MLTTPSHCAAASLTGIARPQLKRKRSDSDQSASTACTDSHKPPTTTKQRTDYTEDNDNDNNNNNNNNNNNSNNRSSQHTPAAAPNGCPSTPASTSTDVTSRASPSVRPTPAADRVSVPRKMDVEKLRDTIESELSLEILLRHNELRLIDQEMAKCQVALEQLRRCAEIPYPGSAVAGLSQSVSNGTGAATASAVSTPGNGPAPLSPAPWGVTDGPYTSHYSRWLLPDPRFDGGDITSATAPVQQPQVEGRATRGNSGGDGNGYVASKTRPHRGSTGAKLQSLPSGYPPPKERAGPMIIRRKSDGVYVKLVCLDCRRDNFSSTQGFINHCRIAHNRNFASHDAAAVASGEPVEVDDAGAIVGGQMESSSSSGTTPGYVHPLVRSAHVIESTPSASTPRRGSRADQSSTVNNTPTPAAVRPRGATRSESTQAAAASNPSFSASPDAPHLSSLMKHKGVGVDLGNLVGDAKITVDLNGPSESEGEEESDAEPTQASEPAGKDQASASSLREDRKPMRTISQATSRRPCSREGIDPKSGKPPILKSLPSVQSAHYKSSSFKPVVTSTDPTISSSKPPRTDGINPNPFTVESPTNLSPNTIESNQAPSLVSDDDDDYEAASSDSDSPSSNGSVADEAADGDDKHFEHIEMGEDEISSASTTSDPKKNPNPGPTPALTGSAVRAKTGNGNGTGGDNASLSKPVKRGAGAVTKKGRQRAATATEAASADRGKRVDFVNPSTGANAGAGAGAGPDASPANKGKKKGASTRRS